ncbi:MAG: AI-2E family transporter [Halanaerobiales bacterium]|nr:AI-2E family transporter [Halanaerobiales bacterium]
MYQILRKYPTTFVIFGIILLLFIFIKYLPNVTTYVLIAGFLAYLCLPTVTFFTDRKVNRNLVIFIIFIIALAICIFLFSQLIPQLVSQAIQFVKEIPTIYDSIVNMINTSDSKILEILDLESYLVQFGENIAKISTTILNLISQKVQGFGSSLIFIPLLFYYFLRDFKLFPGLVDTLFPKSYYSEIHDFFTEYNKLLACYFRGQLIIAALVAVSAWLTLTLLGVDFALVVAILCGILNFIPVLGPIIATVPGILLALIKSPLTALIVAIVLFFINQVTSNVVFPSLISRQIHLSPVIIIISVLAAGSLLGLAGFLMVLPIILLIKLFWLRYIRPELDQL